MEEQPDRDAIIDEAIGQTHGTEPPSYSAKRESTSPEEAARRLAPAPGAQASMSEKTAASLGERVGDAYAELREFPAKPARKRWSTNRNADRFSESHRSRPLDRTGAGAECIRAVLRSAVRELDCRLWLRFYDCSFASRPALTRIFRRARERHSAGLPLLPDLPLHQTEARKLAAVVVVSGGLYAETFTVAVRRPARYRTPSASVCSSCIVPAGTLQESPGP